MTSKTMTIGWKRMDKETKDIYQDIMKSKNLEENLPGLFNRLADKYHTLASVRLAMHYFAFYENFCDGGERWGAAAIQALTEINRIIGGSILNSRSGPETEEAVRAVDRLRNGIMDRMKLLTAYADLCQIHEYILNRLEYRFKEVPDAAEDEEFAREILRFIFEDQDNVVINDRIREIIGQLPVRITKQRYFDLIRNSIREYQGASQDTLDSYLYMLRTASMLELKGEKDALYPLLWEQKEALFHRNYQNISAEEWNKAEKELKKAVAFIEAEIDVYYAMQELVNETYTLILCNPYTGMAANPYERADRAAFDIIRGIHEEFEKGRKQEPSVELLEHFHSLEGIQEELSYDLTVMEEALYQADTNHRRLAEGIMAAKLLNVLLLARDLLSNSLFIDFYEIKSRLPVSAAGAEEAADGLVGELKELFGQCDRIVGRAVMANTMSKLPVFFQNHKEVMDYVLYALEKCSDSAEKAACRDIIAEIISA